MKVLLTKLLLYYLLFAPVIAMPFYNTVLFHPSMTGDFDIEWIYGIKRQEVFFPSGNGQRLHGWLFEQPDAEKVILVSHGNGGNLTHRAWLAKLLLESGASVFMYDYQGYGKSRGSYSIPHILDDGLAAYDYLVEARGLKAENIILFGESLGTGVACWQASRRPAGGLILQQPYRSLPEIAKSKMLVLNIYPLCLFPKERLNNKKILAGKHPPLLVLHGKKDRIIPYSESRSLMDTTSEPKKFVFLPRADHNDIYFIEREGYKKNVVAFLSSLE